MTYDPNWRSNLPQQPQQPQPYQGQWPPPPGATPQYPPQQPPRRPRKRRGGNVIGVLAGLAVAIVIIVALASHGSSTPPAASPGTSAPASAATTAAQPAASTVTYVVTGSSADVTYGPEGSDSTGTVPMRKTAAIPSSPPGYYAITAQLQGGGSVSCEILVGSTVVSHATASGGYGIADCEITQDPLSGQWQDANAA